MRTEEIKETKVIGTRYIADDGTKFLSQEECMKYEKSALFVTRSKLKLIAITDEEDFAITGCYDNVVEVFDIQTQEDLDNLKAYLHIALSIHGVKDMNTFFGDSEFSLANVTLGHEVIIWWSYDQDCFWVYGNGSIEAYIEYVRQRALKSIEKYKEREENKNKSE